MNAMDTMDAGMVALIPEDHISAAVLVTKLHQMVKDVKVSTALIGSQLNCMVWRTT